MERIVEIRLDFCVNKIRCILRNDDKNRFAIFIPDVGMFLSKCFLKKVFFRDIDISYANIIIALFIIIERKTGMTKPSCGILLRDLLNRLS
jgi:hypothetical protein